jgi:hypothetical protein
LNAGDDLIRGPAGPERGEHVADGGLDLDVRVDDRDALVVVDEPDRQRETQLAAFGGRPLGTLEPTGKEMQLGF